jgi:hypothetical protein
MSVITLRRSRQKNFKFEASLRKQNYQVPISKTNKKTWGHGSGCRAFEWETLDVILSTECFSVGVEKTGYTHVEH